MLAARFLTNSAADQALAGRLAAHPPLRHVIAVPYAAVVVDKDERDDGRTVFVVATRPGGRGGGRRGLGQRRGSGAERAAAGRGGGVCGGDAFAGNSRTGDAELAKKAVGRAPEQLRADVPPVLQAMPWREARAKLDARKRLKDALAAAGSARLQRRGVRAAARARAPPAQPPRRRRLARRLAARARPRRRGLGMNCSSPARRGGGTCRTTRAQLRHAAVADLARVAEVGVVGSPTRTRRM